MRNKFADFQVFCGIIDADLGVRTSTAVLGLLIGLDVLVRRLASLAGAPYPVTLTTTDYTMLNCCVVFFSTTPYIHILEISKEAGLVQILINQTPLWKAK